MNPVGIPENPVNLSSLTSVGLERYGRGDFGKDLNDEQAKQVAKDFESVLLHKLLDAMKKTVPESNLFETGISKQFQDIFWLHLAQEMADQGGLGIWKMIYQQMNRSAEGAKGVAALENEK